MVEEVEIDLKNARAVWDRRSRQPTGSDVEGHLPPVTHHRGQRKPDFTDDLHPHMKSGVGISPRLQGQTGPYIRARRKSTCSLRSHKDLQDRLLMNTKPMLLKCRQHSRLLPWLPCEAIAPA